MGERRLVIDHLKFSYEGLFNADEFYTLFSQWFFDKKWDWFEKVNEELVTPQGKQLRLVYQNWKSVSEYYKLMMNIKIHMIDVKEVEVENKGKKLRLHHGVIRITFDGYVFSDRTGEWTSSPFFWFLSVIFENYFFKNHWKRYETWLESDVDDLHHKIKEYLNTFKYEYQT